MRELFGFIKNIGSFYKFWKDYEFNGNAMAYIIEQYQSVISNRTRCLSKPTYSAETIVCALDEWYEKVYEECKEDDDKIESFELELDKFCEGCGHFCPDVTKIDVSSMEDMFNHDQKFRTYIKCTKCEVCRHVKSKLMESKNEKP
jgi:hypothetical protein